MLLSDMKPGQAGIVTGFAPDLSLKRRLQDLGLIVGTRIDCISKSPLGDPTAFLIRRAVIALRREDTEKIWITEAGTWNR